MLGFLRSLSARSRVLLTFGLLLLGASPLHAAGEPLPLHAEEVFRIGSVSITNSMIMVWIVAAVIILVAQAATREMKLVPSGLQNFVEWIVESLINFMSTIMGPELARRTFWFFGTVFILILFCNWAALIPGVGTVGWMVVGEGVDPYDRFKPFFRGANADLNMTMAMALTFAVLWFYWAITTIGLKHFLQHIFAPKGEFRGPMLVAMILIFAFVGIIEVVSIAVRPVALMFRLYGNIFAGENILESMQLLVGKHVWLAWLPPLPFYFFELLVGFVQALVFTLLSAVFLKLICEEEHAEEHADESGDANEPADETMPNVPDASAT